MRYVLGAVIGLVLAGLVFRVFELRAQQAETADGGRGGALKVSVAVAMVERGPLRDAGKFYGSFEAKYRILVSPKIAGRVEKLAVAAGDKVKPGQLLAELDADELKHAVDEASAALTVARATFDQSASAVELAQREFDRIERMFKTKVVTQQELEKAESDLTIKKAVHSLNAAQIVRQQATLDAAEVRRDYATITAAWDESVGSPERYVGERYVDEGTLLKANDPICSIIDVNLLTAALDVPERLFPRMVPGTPVGIRVNAYPGETFMGVLRVRPAELSSSSRQARVEVDVPNPDGRLAPGMFVEGEVVFEEFADVPRVPVAAVVRRDDKQGVYVVEHGAAAATGEVTVDRGDGAAARPAPRYQARFVPIVTGVSDGGYVELKAPDIVRPIVVLGQHRLLDKTAVELDEAARLLVDALPPGSAAGGGDGPAPADAPPAPPPPTADDPAPPSVAAAGVPAPAV